MNRQSTAIYTIKEMVMTFFRNTYPIIDEEDYKSNNDDLDDEDTELSYGNIDKNIERALEYRVKNKFPEYQDMENKLDKAEFDAFYFSTTVMLSKEEVKDGLLNLFLDASINLRSSIKEKERDSFTTFIFTLEYEGIQVVYLQDIYSVKHLHLPLPSPYFVFSSFYAEK